MMSMAFDMQSVAYVAFSLTALSYQQAGQSRRVLWYGGGTGRRGSAHDQQNISCPYTVIFQLSVQVYTVVCPRTFFQGRLDAGVKIVTQSRYCNLLLLTSFQ